MRELLHESGSIFVQISDENVHHVREIMDEVFGAKNFVAQISYTTTSGQTSRYLASTTDFLLWYAKDTARTKFRSLFVEKVGEGRNDSRYTSVELADGTRRLLTQQERANPTLAPAGARLFMLSDLSSQRQGRPAGPGSAMYFRVEFDGETFLPQGQRGWTTTAEGMKQVIARGRVAKAGNLIRYIRYLDDFPLTPVTTDPKVYVVQTGREVIARAMLMTTDPGDLVMDTTCGSGTTAVVAEQWGRRWITCDTSRVATTLAKQRLMTGVFDYYELARPDEGVGSGFRYKTVPHITLKSIANNEPPTPETLYDQPYIDNSKMRVTGPFTIEAVPAPMAKSIDEIGEGEKPLERADESIARSGETLRQSEWRDELMRAGIRGKNGQMILFSRVEPFPGTRWLHADAETKPNDRGGSNVNEMPAQRVAISFGPEYAPLEQKQVELAIEEARSLVPKPKIIVFAAFQFDPEGAKDIDETNWPGMTLLKAQMNADLLTEDLKKKRASNESFWLIGQPDIQLRKADTGERKEKSNLWKITVGGFDYYNTKTG